MNKTHYASGTVLGLIGTLGLGALVAKRFLHPTPYTAQVQIKSSNTSEALFAQSRDSLQPGTYRVTRARHSRRVGTILETADGTVRRQISALADAGQWDWDALMFDAEADIASGDAGPASGTHVIHVHGQSLGPQQVLRGLPVWNRLGAQSEMIDLTGLPNRSLDVGASEEIVRRVQAARQAGAERVVLQGWSAGALACSIAASHVDVDALIGISPLLSVRSALQGAVGDFHLPRFVGNVAHRVLTTPGVSRLAGTATPVGHDTWAQNSGVSTLLMHSKADSLVAGSDVAALAAMPNVTTQAFQTAPHTLEWNENPNRWETLIEDFAKAHSLAR